VLHFKGESEDGRKKKASNPFKTPLLFFGGRGLDRLEGEGKKKGERDEGISITEGDIKGRFLKKRKKDLVFLSCKLRIGG